MPTDHELLGEYARSRSETAFALIVQRHLNLVYSVALRRTRDPELARDASQIVFVDLARKAGRLRSGLVLSAWLHRATVFAASRLVRAERRRAQREEAVMSEELCSTAEASWDDIAPLLDEAVHNLSEPDRQAVLLRFFENKTHQDVARALGVSEEAARKRTDRALERLRAWLTQRGVRTSVAGLTTLVSAHAVQGAPAGLGAALASSVTGSAGSVSLFTQLVHAMTTTQIKGGLAAVAMAGLAVPLVLQHQSIAGLKIENHALEQRLDPLTELDHLRAENQRLAALQVDADELAEWRRVKPELMRLRGEVGVLQAQLSEVEAAKARLTEELGKAKGLLDRSRVYSWVLKRDEWQNKGLDDPIDAVETLLWGWNSGDRAALEAAVLFPDGIESAVEKERFLRSLLPGEKPSVTRSDRINVFWHSGDRERTVRTIVGLERYVFVEHPSEYRENLMAWDLANVDGEWKIFRKRPFFGIDPEEHPHLHRGQPGPL